MPDTDELLQKPLQKKTWHKLHKPERGEELACAGTWGKTTAEKNKRQYRKYVLDAYIYKIHQTKTIKTLF